MKRFENVNLEFKEVYVSDIKKEVVAFANAEGGVVCIGIRQDGTIIGVDDPDDVMLRVSSALRDSINPDVLPFVQIRTAEREGKAVVEVQVQTGTARPYYLKEKGLKPSGVYVRKGSASMPVSDDGIREMIVETSGKSYESCRSMQQELTFDHLEKELNKRSIEFGSAQMRTLQLVGEDGLYTNLAKLLSDQCEHTIKAAIFQGTDKAIFRSRKEFSGSILKQAEEVYQFIDLNNKTKATFAGLERMDQRDYPEEAVREAMLNCIVHRDYAFSGSTLINIYDDRIEFVSLGGLVPGISVEAIFMGVSQSRNPKLADLFYRMRLIESYGTGISKIMRLYENERMKPQFDTAKGVFRVILPNCNEAAEYAPTQKVEQPVLLRERMCFMEEEERVCNYVRERGKITRKEAESLLQTKPTKTYNLLKRLCREGKLQPKGSGKNSIYILSDKKQ